MCIVIIIVLFQVAMICRHDAQVREETASIPHTNDVAESRVTSATNRCPKIAKEKEIRTTAVHRRHCKVSAEKPT